MLFLPSYATRAERVRRLLLLVFVLGVMLLLVAPLFIVPPLSFSKDQFFTFPIPAYSLHWYRDFFASSRWIAAVFNSVITAAFTAILATVLGTMAALGLVHPGFPWRRVVMAAVLSPMIVPIVITAVGAYLFYGHFGLVNTRAGLVLAHTALAVPFVIITVVATLSTYDTNLTRAARSLGAPPLAGFFRVTLPEIAPGVASGAVLAWATSFNEVVVALYLTGPDTRTLPVQMFSGMRDQINPTIMAAATMLFVFSTALFAAVILIGAARRK